MEWHRRLDQEEAEVLQLERMLLNCNNGQTPPHQSHQDVSKEDDGKPSQTKMERKLKEIDKSLRELNSITSTDGGGSTDIGGDFVRTSGSKLNKLWRRLTSQRIEKFDPNKKYKLCKSDLEQLYEDAKLAVLQDFGENAGQMEVLLAQTSTSTQQSTTSGEVPRLNLNFSSGQSDVDVVRGNYSPCAAQEVFLGFAGTSTSSRDGLSEESNREDEPLSKRRVGRSNSSPSLSSLPEMPSSQGNKPSESLANVTSLPRDVEVGVVSSHKSQSVGSGGDDGSANKSENDVSSQEMMHSSNDRNVQTESVSKSVVSEISDDEHAAAVGSASVVEEETIGDVCSKSASVNRSHTHSSDGTAEHVKTASVSKSQCTGMSEIASAIDLTSKTGGGSSSIPTARSSAGQPSEVQSSSSLTQSASEAVRTVSARTETISQVTTAATAKTESRQSATISEESKSVQRTNEIHTKNSNSTLNTESSGSHKFASSVQDDIQQSNSSQNRLHSRKEPTHNTNTSSPLSTAFESCLKSAECGGSSNGTITSEMLSEVVSSRAYMQRSSGQSQSSIGLASESDANDEIWTKLRSIKSLDHSTNSKHSSNSAPHLNASSIESHFTAPSTIVGGSVEEVEDNDKNSPSQGTSHTYSSAFESSNQVRSSVIISTNEVSSQKEDSDTLANAFYESDFTEAEETNIDDLSLPKLEATGDDDEEVDESQLNGSQSPSQRTELESRLIELDVSLKDLNVTFEKALSPDKALSPSAEDGSSRCQSEKAKDSGDSTLMPDVVNEIELRRRQQVMLENEMKQFEHAVPYMYVREIPNKPPPPYVPPAHGSPMTTIFPSEERIREITYRRTSELYYEMLNIDTTDESGKKPPSLMDEKITNIYERIILDICKEYLTEYEKVLTSADPNNFHSPLAFFNPPDRLKCMQDFIYKEVRKSLAMDKNAPKRSQVYSVYGHRGKRDHIGEIIIQEMYEEDDQWCNFYTEESEVLDLIIDELIVGAVRDIATEVLEAETPNASPTVAAVAKSTHEVPSNRST